MSVVALMKAENSEQSAVTAAVRSAIDLVGGLVSIIKPGATVLLKPNVFAPMPSPATTDPRVVAAIARLCHEAGAGRVIVGEGRSISTAKYRPCDNTTGDCFTAVGMRDALVGEDVEFLALEDDEFCDVDVPDGEVLTQARVPRTVLDADVFINLPSLKIHSLTLVTLGIKNLHGIISDDDKLYGHCYREARLARKLVDILRVRMPDLTVVAGLQGLEGDHTLPLGKPVDMGIVIAGRDVVAVDAVAGAAMGLDAMEIDTTRIAHEQGLGTGQLEEIEIRGKTLDVVKRPFARPEITISEKRFPGLRVLAGDYCRSCEYYICRGLEGLQQKGLLSPEHPLTLVLGQEPDVPDDVDGPVIFAGDCCMESSSVKRLRNRLLLDKRLAYVWACPPMEFRIRAGELVG
jgi:uncharacterized protein (DUF362 family)